MILTWSNVYVVEINRYKICILKIIFSFHQTLVGDQMFGLVNGFGTHLSKMRHEQNTGSLVLNCPKPVYPTHSIYKKEQKLGS